MGKILQIKGKTIGKGTPRICVPVMGQSKEEIVREIGELAEKKVPMIEWRVDAFSGAAEEDEVREVLAEVKPFLEESILVFTFRSAAQGGCPKFKIAQMNDGKIWESDSSTVGQGREEIRQSVSDNGALSKEQICRLHRVGAQSGAVDFVDVEFFEAENGKEEIRSLQEMGAYVIVSHHDFDKTPESEKMRDYLEKMRKGGADVVKLAVMPESPSDVIRLLAVTEQFHRANPDTPLITMSMGALGKISRIAGEIFGSCVTFGAAEEASAPGQLPMGELAQILDILHEG